MHSSEKPCEEGVTAMRRCKQWRPMILAVAFALAIVLSNCNSPSNQTRNSPTPSPSPAAAPVGALVYGSVGQPVNLEPGNISDGNSIMVQDQIYNRLMEFKPGTTELVPGLATEWSVSKDGKTCEIWGDLFGGYKGSAYSFLQEVVVEGKNTVKFLLKQPFAAFPSAIAAGYFGIASPSAIKKAGASYGTPSSTAVGTGPFIFKEWRPGDRIVLEKNPNYWKRGFPKSDQLVMRFITDPAARLAQLRAGTIDFTVDLTPDQLAEIQRDPNLQAINRPSFNVGYLGLNPSYKPLSKIEVRQAIAVAINQKEIVKAFWGELGECTGHFTPPLFEDYQSEKVTKYPYNPPAAKQTIAQAGYPNGFDLDLWYMPVSRPYFPNPKPIAEAFAADLSAIGIRVKLLTKDWSAYLADRKKPPGYQAFMLGWTGDASDPDNFYYSHFGPGATTDLGNWKNDQVIKLLNQGRATGDKAERTKIYKQVDEILYQEVVRIPIVHSQPLLAKRKKVTGWTPSPLGSEPLDEVTKS